MRIDHHGFTTERIRQISVETATDSILAIVHNFTQDGNLPLTVQADASKHGLRAALLQQGEPVAFASKSLSETEQRYANIERELLAVLFTCKRFKTYVLGRDFTVESDHKPLEMIALKNLVAAPPRL